MKRVWLAILTCILLLSSISLVEFGICKLAYDKNKKESENILRIAYHVVNNQNTNYEETLKNEVTMNAKENMLECSDIIGILKIPKLQIEAPIKDGTSQEIMRTSIGHFIESDYWNGNVSFASHNSGTNAHFFENINYLNENDEIEYITKLGTKKYKVQDIKKIESTDWSMVVSNNENKNTITLITCITGQPKYRLCVRGVETI
ncbi:MAG: class D sortase [Clostridia bacterium]|nr:class D sortase [Clostridia bacterium]